MHSIFPKERSIRLYVSPSNDLANEGEKRKEKGEEKYEREAGTKREKNAENR